MTREFDKLIRDRRAANHSVQLTSIIPSSVGSLNGWKSFSKHVELRCFVLICRAITNKYIETLKLIPV